MRTLKVTVYCDYSELEYPEENLNMDREMICNAVANGLYRYSQIFRDPEAEIEIIETNDVAPPPKVSISGNPLTGLRLSGLMDT